MGLINLRYVKESEVNSNRQKQLIKKASCLVKLSNLMHNA